MEESYDYDGELNARLWIEDVTGILMDDPPSEIESLEQLNEWRINQRELGSKKFARVLRDGIFLCRSDTVMMSFPIINHRGRKVGGDCAILILRNFYIKARFDILKNCVQHGLLVCDSIVNIEVRNFLMFDRNIIDNISNI